MSSPEQESGHSPSVGESALREAWRSAADTWIPFARSSEADAAFHTFNLPEFPRLLPPPGRLTVEIGCGEGRVSRALQNLGHDVIGVDVAPSLVKAAAAHPAATPVLVADAAALPLGSSSADLAVLFMVLADVDDLTTTVREVARILRPGGRLCIATGHPLQGTGEFMEDGAYVMTRPYFEERRLTYFTQQGGQPVPLAFRHRPLTAYTEALEHAGFVLEAVREPVPDETASAALPDASQRRQVPSFLYVRARKS